MLGEPAGYCVYTNYECGVSLDFYEDYEDAVEALREFVLAFSNLSAGKIQKMNVDQLMDEIDEIADRTEKYVRSYIITVRFQEKQGR